MKYHLLIMLFFFSCSVFSESPASSNYSKGVAAAIYGKINEAKTSFKKALDLDKNDEDSYLGLKITQDVTSRIISKETAVKLFTSHLFYIMRKHKKAIIGYTSVIKNNPKYDIAYASRAKVYVDIGWPNAAITDLDIAIKINPKNRIALNNRALVYSKQGKLDKAIDGYTNAIKVDQKRAISYFNRGYIHSKKGNIKQAIKDYSKAIELNPNFALAYSSRGYTYLKKLNNKSKGCNDLKKSCDLGECRNYNSVKSRSICP